MARHYLHPYLEWRQLVRELAESQWGEPVVVVCLGDVSPEYAVPGRRKDGTVKGQRLVRRFFWNILRGTAGTVASVALSIGGGGFVNAFSRFGHVTGPENAQALPMVDAARKANTPWLVHSASHVAVVDSGYSFHDPADSPPPAFVWQAARPYVPEVAEMGQRLSWPDGSTFDYHLGDDERTFVKQSSGR